MRGEPAVDRAVSRHRRHAGRAPVSTAAAERLAVVDVARTGAIGLMIAYHFCFDLRHFGFITADFERDPFWLGCRAVILSSFLLLVGVSLALAAAAGIPAARFWRRTGQIALGALAVSCASWLVFPRSFIWFGVLHNIAIASVLARPFARRPWTALAIGAIVAGMGMTLAWPAFDATLLSPLGFRTFKPPTEDYVPLFPWAGAVFVGIAGGHLLATGPVRTALAAARVPRWAVWPGRHSLVIYLVHQPFLFALLSLAH